MCTRMSERLTSIDTPPGRVAFDQYEHHHHQHHHVVNNSIFHTWHHYVYNCIGVLHVCLALCTSGSAVASRALRTVFTVSHTELQPQVFDRVLASFSRTTHNVACLVSLPNERHGTHALHVVYTHASQHAHTHICDYVILWYSGVCVAQRTNDNDDDDGDDVDQHTHTHTQHAFMIAMRRCGCIQTAR